MLLVSLQRIFYTLFFIYLSFIGFAQKTSFFLNPKWQKGEIHRFELLKGKHIFRENKKFTENESLQNITLTIEDISSKGYILSAQYGNSFQDTQPLEVRYAVSQSGEFQGILNIDNIKKTFGNIFESLTSSVPPPSVARLVGEIRTQMTSDNYLTNNFFQEWALIHQFYNNSFTVDSLEYYETQLPNLLDQNGVSINAHATLLAKHDGKLAYIRHTIEPDKERMKQMTLLYINRMSASNSSKLSANILNTEGYNLSIFDENFCSFDLKTGWFLDFQRKRTIIENDVKTVEFLILRERKE